MRRFGVLAFALLCAVQTLLAANKQAETFNMQKAYEAFQNQDYQTAVDCLNKELADDAKNGYAYLWMAIAYTTVDDYGSMLNRKEPTHTAIGALRATTWGKPTRLPTIMTRL